MTKLWSLEEYYRLSELGFIDENERTELIAGQIVTMARKTPSHATALRLLSLLLNDFLCDRSFLVRTQDPIHLSNLSAPNPDLVIVPGEILTYIDHHPFANEVRLIVEIADTATLQKDCKIKDKIYAESGLQEYWVIDLKYRKLHVFRQPTKKGYDSHLILSETSKISPIAFPMLSVEISSVLPPQN